MAEHEEQSAANAETLDDNAPRGSRPWTSVVLPAELRLVQRARELLFDSRVRVKEIGDCIATDPILVIEILKVANSVQNAAASTVTSIRKAIVSLGVDTILRLLDEVTARPQFRDPEVAKHYTLLRERAVKTASVSRIVAGIALRDNADSCYTASLLTMMGDMVTLAHLKHRYVEIAEEFSRRSQVVYRLVKDYELDVERVGFEYLKHHGIPSEVYTALQREGGAGGSTWAVMRAVCLSASEMVECFEAGKWTSLAPGKKIPPKSPIRMLKVDDTGYAEIFKRVNDFFSSGRADEVSGAELAQDNLLLAQAAVPEPVAAVVSGAATGIGPLPEQGIVVDVVSATPIIIADPSQLEGAPPAPPLLRRPDTRMRVETTVHEISVQLVTHHTKEGLFTTLLDTLLEKGPFVRAALMVIAQDERRAMAVAVKGDDTQVFDQIEISDPLSPLLQGLGRVQSFSRFVSKCSPFGSTTFALAPLDAQFAYPVVLYADCGPGVTISFEARRVFRSVVEKLNDLLPELPGEVPAEWRRWLDE